MLWICSWGYAQENPPIRAYFPKEYRAENQNWGISQAGDKRMYFANNGGLLRFNGAQWELFPSINNTIIRSVKAVGDRIYTGCYREFGYWKENKKGQLEYTSLSQKLAVPLVDDEQFWRIISQGSTQIFQSLNRLYLYHETTGKVKIITAPSTITKVFTVDDQVFFQVLGKGLFQLAEGKSKLISDHPLVKQEELIEIVSRSNHESWWITQKKGIWLWKNQSLSPVTIPQLTKQLQNTSIYSALLLHNGDVALGTISKGLLVVSSKDNQIDSFPQASGVTNNTILSIYQDLDHSIWLATDNGISVIHNQSPWRTYHDVEGKIGTVYAAQELGNYLYLGSNQGLFVRDKTKGNEFSMIPGTNGQVWCLKKVGNDLLCGHHVGTFLVQGTSVELISSLPGTWELKAIPSQSDALLQGTYSGLSVIRKIQGRWSFQYSIAGLPTLSCRFIEWISPREVLVNHEYKGVYRFLFSEDLKQIQSKVLENTAPIGLRSGLGKFKDQVYYFSDQGVFRYHRAKGFVLDRDLSERLWKEDGFYSGRFLPDPTGDRFYLFNQKNVVIVSSHPTEKGFLVKKIAFPAEIRRDRIGYENVFPTQSGNYLIGTTDGYFVLNPKRLQFKPFSVHLQSISNGPKPQQLSWVDASEFGVFTSENRTVGFRYYVPSFSPFELTGYRYRLEGKEDHWSDWTTASEIVFENLAPGQYVFSVMAQVQNQTSQNTVSYAFEVKPAWYASKWAKGFYAILVIASLVSVNRWSQRYYQRQQQKALEESQRALERIKLESEQKLMHVKNEQLEHEIQSKNRELTLSTLSIAKKNEILGEIKRALQQAEKPQNTAEVTELIEANLNDTKDWEFLEEAFNHADKDFLKKLKSNHPDLTPHDLRFCAYLRLNLTSKEIAPLLNISVRSVEIKRYRIRKKMDLPHEKSLVDYILSI